MKRRLMAIPGGGWPLLLVLLASGGARAQSPGWPQWGGPTRDFKTTATGLSPSWPAGGPREVWSRPLGDGYSGIVVEGGALYTMYRPVKGVAGKQAALPGGPGPEIVTALDAATGKTLWEQSYDAPFREKMDMEYGPGPHVTPLLVGGRVFTVGTTGKLMALDARTGRVAWSHELWSEYRGRVMGRGYSCSPIAYGDTIIVSVGGPGQGLMAFGQQDGRVVWKGTDLPPSPSSPILINVDGQEQLVTFHAKGVAGLDPKSGALYWDHEHPTDYGLNISTPVWGEGNLLFMSSAYSGGSRVLRLSQAGGKTRVEQVWFSNKLRIHIGNALRLGDHVYASSGDFGPAFFTAVDVRDGRVAWQERGLARAVSLLADGRLLILDEEGVLALASVTPQAMTIHTKAKVLSKIAWTVPTLVGSRLYLRDRATIKALELGR
jgi:outer membrane protein assembly factor BamB